MESQHEFADLMRRVEQGSPEAARELYERYGPKIRSVVRRKLSSHLRSKFDSQDLVQDVWKSFFTGHHPPGTFDRPEALMAFLATLAYNKVADLFRWGIDCDKRDVTREHSFDSSTVYREGEPASRLPTPSQLAVEHEQWERLMQGQSARHQRILELLRQGEDREQIARELGISERTIRRLLRRLLQGRRP